MAQLKSTNVVGNLSVTGNILASKIIKLGGTSTQILMADGSTMNAPSAGLGTVTSVGVTSSSLTVTGSPITSSGTITIEHPTATATTADIYKIGKDGQGHVVIGDKITPADLGLSQVYKYRGTKTWDELLAITKAEIGDVYSITNKDPDGNTNADWACCKAVSAACTTSNYSTYWQSLGGKVDLSAYVQGPASATDNAIARFDTTTGKLIQNSSVSIDDSGNVVPATTAASELGSSSIAWKRAYIHQLDLYREKGNNYGRISFYKPTMYTWFEYMSPNGVASPTGANTVQYGEVTSWARRSLIEPNSGYGWTWEAASNSANAAVSGIMALSSATGNLKVKGSVTANGFKHSDATKGNNNYVLLAGGDAKPLSEFALGGNIQVKSGDILAIANNELSTTYSITTSVAVGNLAKGTTVNGSVKDLLDLVFGTPTTISNLTLTAASGSFEKGTTKSLTKAVVKVGKGTAKTLDKIEIKSGSTVLASITSVVEGNNTITIPSTNITSDTTITALLTYDTNNSKSTTASYSFFFYSYYGAVASNVSVDSITYTSLSKKNGKSSLTITMSNQCAILAIPGTPTTIKDENNFDCTANFSKTTKTITNSLGASTSYTVFKLITPVSGTKTYTVS
jgi:hypothetical protein